MVDTYVPIKIIAKNNDRPTNQLIDQPFDRQTDGQPGSS